MNVYLIKAANKNDACDKSDKKNIRTKNLE